MLTPSIVAYTKYNNRTQKLRMRWITVVTTPYPIVVNPINGSVVPTGSTTFPNPALKYTPN